MPRLQETMEEESRETEKRPADTEESVQEGNRLDLSQIRRDELEELLRELIG